MNTKCDGCEEEFAMACEYVNEGYHLATTLTQTFENKHFHIIIVDDEGKILVW